jgi:nitrite reductase/ring-hydroxylating ferredoxin subunit
MIDSAVLPQWLGHGDSGDAGASGKLRLKAKGHLIARGPHRPILVVCAHERVFAFDNRYPHMGFPLDRGSVEDGMPAHRLHLFAVT